MKFSLILCVLIIVTYCDGGLIGDLINGAHNTASAIVGGFTGGLQFGLGGGGGHQRHPQHNRHKPHRPGNQDTVVVVVEDEADSERPGYSGEGQYNENRHGNFNGPHNGPGQNQNPNKYIHGNTYENQYPSNFNQNGNGNWNNDNQGNGNGQYGTPNVKPNHQLPQNPNNQEINPDNQQYNQQNQYNQHNNQNHKHAKPNYYHNQQNNQFGNPNNEQGNLHNQNENSNYHQGNQNGQYGNTNNQPIQPNNQNENFNNRPVNPNNQYENSNSQYGVNENFNNQDENINSNGNINRPAYPTGNPHQSQPNYHEQTTSGDQVKPPIDANTNLPGESNNKVEKTTIDPTGVEAYPLFIPLSPNQYHYGGDKVEINAPKREVDNSKLKPADEDDFQIDVRMDNV